MYDTLARTRIYTSLGWANAPSRQAPSFMISQHKRGQELNVRGYEWNAFPCMGQNSVRYSRAWKMGSGMAIEEGDT